MDISVSLFIALGYLITMTGGGRVEGGGWAPAYSVSRLSVSICAKNSRDEDGDRRCSGTLPHSSAGRGGGGIVRCNDLSPSLARGCAGATPREPAKLFFSRNVDRRYFYIPIDLQLSKWH